MLELKPRRARLLSVVLLLMVAVEALGLLYLKQLPFSRISVLSYDAEADLYWHPTPGERSAFTDSRGVEHVIVSPRYSVLHKYRSVVEEDCLPDLTEAQSDLQRASIVRHWARQQYEFSVGSGKVKMFDYRGLFLNRMSDAGLCDAFATLYVGASISMGLPARLVHLNTTVGTASQGHYVAEVYLPDQRQWVVMDPLYDCYYTVGGKAVSALELHRLARKDKALASARAQPPGLPRNLPLDNYYDHFQIINRTDFDTHRLSLFGDKLLFLNWVGDGAKPLGRQEAALRVILFFIWPVAGLAVAAVLIIGGRPRTSLFILVGKKPIRPEYRE